MSIKNTIEELVIQAESAHPAEAIINSLTLGGRIDKVDALKALSGRDKKILSLLQEARGNNESRDIEFVLSAQTYGRCVLLPAEEYLLHAPNLIEVKRFFLSSDENLKVKDAERQDELALHRTIPTLKKFFEEEGYAQIAEHIDDALQHMAPLISYVGRECFSNFYTIGKSGVAWEHDVHAAIAKLKTELADAPLSIQVLAYYLTQLLRSGSYTRIEEMNACQLNEETVRSHFLMKFDAYREVCVQDAPEREQFLAMTTPEQSTCLAMLRPKVLEHGRFVRDISGLNLLKKERFISYGNIHSSGQKILNNKAYSRTLVECIVSDALGKEFSWESMDVHKLLSKNGVFDVDHAFDSDIEYLIDRIIRRAVDVTGSDVGMSRGTRDYRRFMLALSDQRVAEACEWSQSEYFCHAVPSDALLAQSPVKRISSIINAVSSRMRYNTWHYSPSYFDLEKIPSSRTWFHAPRMADIADWDDQHRSGHAHAGIRNSIRSPHNICLNGKLLPGFVDLRLMKKDGDRYT